MMIGDSVSLKKSAREEAQDIRGCIGRVKGQSLCREV